MDEAVNPKIASRRIMETEKRFMTVKAGNNAEENARLARQLVFMARLTHPEKTLDDVQEVMEKDGLYLALSMGTAVHGMSYNPLVYGPVRFVEDFVE